MTLGSGVVGVPRYLPVRPTWVSAAVASCCVIPASEGTVTNCTVGAVAVGDATDDVDATGPAMLACPASPPHAASAPTTTTTPTAPTTARLIILASLRSSRLGRAEDVQR